MDQGEALRGLGETMERTLAAFAWPAETLARSYGPGKWSARQILGHLTDCELHFLTRLRFVLAEAEPAIVPFDQEAWAKRFRYEAQDMGLMRDLFRALRGAFVEVVRGASEADLRRRGRHPENPEYTAAHIVEHAIEHHRRHLEQLDAIRAGGTWPPR
jgi:uncharacterized damage-inducible protein DinB